MNEAGGGVLKRGRNDLETDLYWCVGPDIDCKNNIRQFSVEKYSGNQVFLVYKSQELLIKMLPLYCQITRIRPDCSYHAHSYEKRFHLG